MPIAVSFTRGAGADDLTPAIDLDDVAARMQNDVYDFTNDPVYVINLSTGLPVPLDMGNGNFPGALFDPTSYWPNDPRESELSVVLETAEEAPGLDQADYRPELDTDFDGVVDHPNVLGAPSGDPAQRIEKLLTWYERETDTLIMKPLVPLEEKTEYAVVLTDRLRGPTGSIVRSPFPYVHHPEQKDAVARAERVLTDGAKKNYYGDIAGTGLDHVAFAWTFTTQPVYEDMRLLRDGIYGKGPFAHLATDFPPRTSVFPAVGLSRAGIDEPGGWQNDPGCVKPSKTPYVVHLDDVRDVVHNLIGSIGTNGYTISGPPADALEASVVDNIDHFVVGSYEAPYYLGDPKHEDPDGRFHLNFTTGQGDIASDTVQFLLTVPRAQKNRKQPFPLAIWTHATSGSMLSLIARAGYLAQEGIATLGINGPGHGLVVAPGVQALVEAFLRSTCMVPLTDALLAGRATDLNGDGIADPGGLLFTAHIFHDRDNLRQFALDDMQAVRVARTWDGTTKSDYDFNNDGQPDLAGDFDGDGTPDVGGPKPTFYAGGDSFGGIVTQIFAAVDPYVTAAAPVSGTGGLTDIAARSSLTPDPVLEQILSPLIVAVPAGDRPPDSIGFATTSCASNERSVRFVVNDLFQSREIEIACLSQGELDAQMSVVLTNVATKESRCARTMKDGRFRLPIAASVGDKLDIQIYGQANAVESYKNCVPRAGAPMGRHINTWERAATHFTEIAADSNAACATESGCAQFRDVFYDVGSPLVAPQEGLGYIRQTPDVRRLLMLAQAALDPGDPINFAPYYMLRPLPGLDGKDIGPRAMLNGITVGDDIVTIAGGSAFARAAGMIPFLRPSAVDEVPELADYATPATFFELWGGKTPNQVLIDSFAMEGVARLARTHAGPDCSVNYVPSKVCTDNPKPDPSTCTQTLFDVDWHSEGTNRFDAPRLDAPLRLARVAGLHAADAASLAKAWEPRIVGAPSAKDETAWNASALVLAHMNAYLVPKGQHVWGLSDPCKAFDDAGYYDRVLSHFLASDGKDPYFLSHPQSHRCLADASCAFLR
jgi:hypothetical protein